MPYFLLYVDAKSKQTSVGLRFSTYECDVNKSLFLQDDMNHNPSITVFLWFMVQTNMATRRQRRREDKTLQLFRPPPGNDDAIQTLFELKYPTKQDLLNYLNANVDGITIRKQLTEEEERYYARRREISLWASQIETGGAQIDEHDRLIQSTGPDPLPIINHELPRNPVHPAAEEEEEERQWLQQEEQDAIMAISRAVKRYRQQCVPETEFHLIRVPQRIRDSAVNLTFRRIGFAVLAVATAFICIMLQTLPILNTFPPANPTFDKLMDELLRVRHFRLHAIHCNGLNRDDTHNWLLGNAPAINCAHGVLHIPSRTVLREEYLQSTGIREMEAMEHYITGVNVSWFIPCRIVFKGNGNTHQMSSCYPGSSNECPAASNRQCFRGIHDSWLTENDVENALRMGAALIKAGGDHFDIHDTVDILDENIPHLLKKVQFLLQREYGLSQEIVPVAFRVNLALPLDARDVLGSKSSSYLSRNINKTVRTYLLMCVIDLISHSTHSIWSYFPHIPYLSQTCLPELRELVG